MVSSDTQSQTWLLCSPLGCPDAWQRLGSTLSAALQQAGQAVVMSPALYHLPEDDSRWAQWRELTGPVVVVADLYPRPAEWLLRRQGIGLGGLVVIDLRTLTTVEQALALGGLRPVEGIEASTLWAKPESPLVERWYPVVDKSRCTECHHCLQFCLFGVYELDTAGRVQVARPDECKAGCPACARVCPHSAIMFPLHDRDPGISGAPGELVQRAADDRRLYYERTGLPCPVCSSLAAAGEQPHPSGVCPECGRAAIASPSQPDATHDAIDALLDQLDDWTLERDS